MEKPKKGKSFFGGVKGIRGAFPQEGPFCYIEEAGMLVAKRARRANKR